MLKTHKFSLKKSLEKLKEKQKNVINQIINNLKKKPYKHYKQLKRELCD